MAELISGTGCEQDLSELFDSDFLAIERSSRFRELFRDAYGRDYPGDIEVFSSCSWWTLGIAIAELRLMPGSTLLDLGCGQGGPGIWLARATNTNLVGVDFSQHALAAARRTSDMLLPGGRATYHLGKITSTECDDESMDGAIAIDSLPFEDDRIGALTELARVLKPSSQAVFTCGERYVRTPGDNRPRWAEAVEAVPGLELAARHDDPGRGERWIRLYGLWQDHEEELVSELGETGRTLIAESRSLSPLMRRREVTHEIFVVRRTCRD